MADLLIAGFFVKHKEETFRRDCMSPLAQGARHEKITGILKLVADCPVPDVIEANGIVFVPRPEA